MKKIILALVALALACNSSPTAPPVPIETVEVTQYGDSLLVTFEPNVAYATAILRMSGPLPTNGGLREVLTKRYDGRHEIRVALFDFLAFDEGGYMRAWVGVTICPRLDCPEDGERYSYFSFFEANVGE